MLTSVSKLIRDASQQMSDREAFDLKKLIEKIPGKDAAIRTLLEFAKKLGKDKILELLSKVEKSKDLKEAGMGSDLVRRWGYPAVLVAAAIFIGSLGKNVLDETKNKIEKMTEIRTQQILDIK